MMRRLCLTLLLLVAAFGLACAHQGAAGYAAGYASGVPLGSFDCYDTGDIYSSRINPCGGIAYGDYEQYPGFTPLAPRQVTLTSDRHREPRVVTRPGFDGSSTSNDSSWSSATTSSGSSYSAPASPPRMDTVPLSAPSSSPALTTVSPRPN